MSSNNYFFFNIANKYNYSKPHMSACLGLFTYQSCYCYTEIRLLYLQTVTEKLRI